MKRSRFIGSVGLLLVMVLLLTPGSQAHAQIRLYGATTNGQLLQIDPNTGAGTLVGPIGFSGIEALEFLSNGTLLGIANNNQLISINRTTGAGALIGTVTGFNWVEGLAFNSVNGTLYGSATTSVFAEADRLITINPATGQTLTTAPNLFGANFWDVDGLAVSPSGTILGAHINTPGASLFSVDPVTGLGTLIGAQSAAVVGMDFAPDGTLYGVTTPNIQTGGPASLVTINPSTGAIQNIGLIGFDNLQSIAVVPEPSTLVLATIAAIGAFACSYRRRGESATMA